MCIRDSIQCPNCGSENFTEIRQFNLMFTTFQGVTEDQKNEIYLRPETAQGILVNFPSCLLYTSRCVEETGVALPGEAGASLWEGVAFGKVLRVEQRGQQVWLDCSPEDYEHTWRAYFDLGEDYAPKREALAAMSPALAEAVAFAPGIRILRQEPWEALCSFILSQNNHIPRIKGIIEMCIRDSWRATGRCSPWCSAASTPPTAPTTPICGTLWKSSN